MNSDKAEKILLRVINKGIAWTHNQGYEWYSASLLPRIESAGKDQPISKELLSDAWYVIGDIHDFNDAPLKAIESYKKSLKYDTGNAAACREIASMYKNIGEYKKALLFINKSLKIDPEEEFAVFEKKDITSEIKMSNKPLYLKGDIIWEMNEYLANQKFDYVINYLKNFSALHKLKVLARAYGASGMNVEYLRTWNLIIAKNKEFKLEYADWFYMPDIIYSNGQIWSIFRKAAKNIKPSIFIQFKSLTKFYSELTAENLFKMKCDYMIHKSKGNLKQLKKMSLKFPKWKELTKY